MRPKRAILRTDGGARPTNPGHAGFAAIVHMDGMAKVISRYIGIKTNNEAEYTGVLVGISYAHFLGARELLIISDSQLVVNQVGGKWQVRSDDLRPLCREVRDKLRKLFPDAWEIRWEKRSRNVDADRYCTEAIHFGMNLNPFVPQCIKTRRVGRVIDPFVSHRALPSKPHAEEDRVRPKGLSSLLS